MRRGPDTFELHGFIVVAHIGATGNGFPIALKQQESAKRRRKCVRGVTQNFCARATGSVQIGITKIIFVSQAIDKGLRCRIQKRGLYNNINHGKPPLKQMLPDFVEWEQKAAVEQYLPLTVPLCLHVCTA